VAQDPVVDIVVELIRSEKTNYLLGWMLVAINLPGVEFDAQINKEGLVIFVNRLVALGVGLFHAFHYLRILNYPVIDVQEQHFALDCVELGDDGFYLDVFEHLLGKIGEFIIRQLGYYLEHFHFAL
jgi:hypothetical protein